MSAESLALLRLYAERQKIADRPWIDGHIYSADCPWCTVEAHKMALGLLDVAAAAEEFAGLVSIELSDPRLDYVVARIDRLAWHKLVAVLDAFETSEYKAGCKALS